MAWGKQQIADFHNEPVVVHSRHWLLLGCCLGGGRGGKSGIKADNLFDHLLFSQETQNVVLRAIA